MDQPPKPPDGVAVLEELKRALDGAARCIELAKQEAARIDAAMRALSSPGVQVEQELLDNARKRREQLSLLDLRFELPPLPPPDLPPAAPLADLPRVTPKPSAVSSPAPADVPEAVGVSSPAPAEDPPPPASLSPDAPDKLLILAVSSPGVAS